VNAVAWQPIFMEREMLSRFVRKISGPEHLFLWIFVSVLACPMSAEAFSRETQRELELFDSLGFSATQSFTNYSLRFGPDGFNEYQLSDAFLLAWKCWKEGSQQQAEDLFLKSKTAMLLRSKLRPKKTYHELLEQELAERFMWQGYLEIGSAWTPRSTSRDEFRLVAENFRLSDCALEARAHFETLDLMVKEDAARPVLPFEEIQKLPLEGKIDELIYALRDQNAIQGRQPGRCDIFWSRNGTTNTAAHYLAAIGRPAVPKLIEALEDRRLTRSIGFHRSFYYSHSAMTVGECARQILERTSGENFHVNDLVIYMLREKEIRETRRVVEKWWSQELRRSRNSGVVGTTES
jgi:hypothetical protein